MEDFNTQPYVVPYRCGEEEGKAINLPVDLRFNPHLWSWVVIERMRLQMQAAEVSVLHGWAQHWRYGKKLRQEAWIRATAPLHCKEPVEVVWHLIRMLPGRVPLEIWRHVQLVGDPGVDPEHGGEIIYLLLGRGTFGLPCLACCHRNLAEMKKSQNT